MDEQRKKLLQVYAKTSSPEELFVDTIEKIEKVEQLVKDIKIPEAINGVTPVKGKDYFDGEPGKTPTDEEIIALIKPFIPPAVPGKDGSIITPEEIRDKLKELKGKERLSVFDLKDIEWVKGKNGEHIQWSSAGFKIFTDTTLTGDGSQNNPLHVASAGGVTKIIAGTNVTISPVSGLGDVTVNATGGGSQTPWTSNIDGARYSLSNVNTVSANYSFNITQPTTSRGTVSTSGSHVVTGTNTFFQNDFKVGDTITINGVTKTITIISSSTALTTSSSNWGTNTNVGYTQVGGLKFDVDAVGKVGGISTIYDTASTPKLSIDNANRVLYASNGTSIGLGYGTANSLYGAGGASPVANNMLNLGQGAGANAQSNCTNVNNFGASTGSSCNNSFDTNNFLGGRSTSNSYESNNIGLDAGSLSSGSYETNSIGGGGAGVATGYNTLRSFYSNFIGRSAGNSAIDAAYSNLFGYYTGAVSNGLSFANIMGYFAAFQSTIPHLTAFGDYAAYQDTNSNTTAGVITTMKFTPSGTGTVSTGGSHIVTGSGTHFLTDLVVNDQIIIAGVTKTVTVITSDVSLTTGGTNWPTNVGVGYALNNAGVNYKTGDVVTIGGGTGGTATVSSATTIVVSAVQVSDNGGGTGSAGGSGYNVGDTVSIDGGDNNSVLQVTSNDGAPGEVTGISLADGGSGYEAGNLCGITGGDGNAGLIVLDVDPGTGAVIDWTFSPTGAGYSTGTNVTTSCEGTGSGFLINIDSVAAGFVTGVSINAGGSGYSNGNNLTTTNVSSSGTDLQVDITSVTGGEITGISLTTGGTAYNKGAQSLGGGSGSGSGADVNIDAVTAYPDTSTLFGRYSKTGGYSNSWAFGHGVMNSANLEANLWNIVKITGLQPSDTATPSFVTGATINAGSNTITTTGTINAGIIKNTATQTTAGAANFSQPEQGSSYKKVVIYLNNLTGAQSYTYPTAFSHTPAAVTTNGLATTLITAISTTAVTVTGAASTGFLFLEGF
jgi:hypothetical protein